MIQTLIVITILLHTVIFIVLLLHSGKYHLHPVNFFQVFINNKLKELTEQLPKGNKRQVLKLLGKAYFWSFVLTLTIYAINLIRNIDTIWGLH